MQASNFISALKILVAFPQAKLMLWILKTTIKKQQDKCLIADQGVMSSISAQPGTLVGIDSVCPTLNAGLEAL